MQYTMAKTQQFGDSHFKKGETVYVRRIGKLGNSFILSKRQSQPVGPTVTLDFLAELVEEADRLPRRMGPVRG